MRKLIILAALLLATGGHANWKDTWVEAVENCHLKNFDKAESLFTTCIKEMESNKEDISPHVYVDRARLYLLLNRHEEALKDLDKAIADSSISKKELTRALVSRMVAKAHLGITNETSEDQTAFWNSLENPPETEFTKDYIIIRNAIDHECFKAIVSNFFYQK